MKNLKNNKNYLHIRAISRKYKINPFTLYNRKESRRIVGIRNSNNLSNEFFTLEQVKELVMSCAEYTALCKKENRYNPNPLGNGKQHLPYKA